MLLGAPDMTSPPRPRNKTNQGCLPCRIRKKKCPLNPDHLGSCQECKRLGLHCEGFNSKLPMWAKNKEKLKLYKEYLKRSIASNRRVMWRGSRPSYEPPTYLSLPDTEALPSHRFQDLGEIGIVYMHPTVPSPAGEPVFALSEMNGGALLLVPASVNPAVLDMQSEYGAHLRI
ncbi:uncharacterized protein EI90DRAFT_3074802 [Cantharellus anzutake]|uniref:uncharacterized protein n=1 Tax=Cantharellus anzutake TaxID=1750568 RepID=UPI001908033B|nr:uncharacterized protein EI90DRAFT_3074802 [Cantharellus anzutake]KAF8324696.1 hypothetical protein EI90DRAFT_3074802 [Cantharellus anzutake]